MKMPQRTSAGGSVLFDCRSFNVRRFFFFYINRRFTLDGFPFAISVIEAKMLNGKFCMHIC